MIDSIARYVGGRVLTAVLAVSGIVVIVWYWRLEPQTRADLWGGIRDGLIWLAFVCAMPWALFFVPPRVVRAESNAVSAATLLAYLAADAAVALYLAGGVPSGAWQRALMLVGFLFAAVYNLVVCEFLAARSEDSC